MTDHSALITTAAERRRLTRAEQLTLTTWRWAFVALCRQVEPQDLLPQSRFRRSWRGSAIAPIPSSCSAATARPSQSLRWWPAC